MVLYHMVHMVVFRMVLYHMVVFRMVLYHMVHMVVYPMVHMVVVPLVVFPKVRKVVVPLVVFPKVRKVVVLKMVDALVVVQNEYNDVLLIYMVQVVVGMEVVPNILVQMVVLLSFLSSFACISLIFSFFCISCQIHEVFLVNLFHI